MGDLKFLFSPFGGFFERHAQVVAQVVAARRTGAPAAAALAEESIK